MASDSEEDEPKAPRRRRDVRLELSQMGIDDEIVNKVLMKIRARRAPAVSATFAPWNESYPTGLDVESYDAASRSHKHPLESWRQTDPTDNVQSDSKIKSCSNMASDPHSPRGTRRKYEKIDEEVETFRIEIQTDAAVPGEVNNDRHKEDSDGKKYIEHYEMVPHIMHRSVRSGKDCPPVVELGKDDHTEAEHTQGTDETHLTYVPEHLKELFVSGTFQRKDNAMKEVSQQGGSFQVMDVANDEHAPICFWPDWFSPTSMDACMQKNARISKGEERNVGTGIPREIVIAKKPMVRQYLTTRIEYAREVAKKEADSKLVSDGKTKLGDVDPRRRNASTRQTSKHDCVIRQDNQTSDLGQSDSQNQDSEHDCISMAGSQAHSDELVLPRLGVNENATIDSDSHETHGGVIQPDNSKNRKRKGVLFDSDSENGSDDEAKDSFSYEEFFLDSMRTVSCGISENFRFNVCTSILHISSSSIDGVQHRAESVQQSRDSGQTTKDNDVASRESHANEGLLEGHRSACAQRLMPPLHPTITARKSKPLKRTSIWSRWHSAFHAAKSKRRRNFESKSIRQNGITWSPWIPPEVVLPTCVSYNQRPISRTIRHPNNGEKELAGPSASAPPPPPQEARLFSRVFSDSLIPVYPGDRIVGAPSHDGGDDWTDAVSSVSGRMEMAVDSINATASELLSTNADIEDMWLAKAVLMRIAEARNTSVDDLIEDVCDKLDELETTLFNPPYALGDSD